MRRVRRHLVPPGDGFQHILTSESGLGDFPDSLSAIPRYRGGMSVTPGFPESPDPDGPATGAPYGQQPFAGGGYGAPGQYDPYQAAAFSGIPPDGAMQMYYPVPPYAPGYGAPVYGASRKEPALSLILSFFLPGLGTIINGQGGKGIGIMLGYFMGALLSVILIGLPILFGFWVWGMVDAYSGAKEHNARYGYY